jgi:thiamine pyrophosphate-dependent acetolactate synthase large subunit-like protein
MEGSERDSTQDWLLPESARPPSVAELSQRIDEAVATAQASEAAVMVVGEAALDAAEQARRAAELAERASAAVFGGSRGVQPGEARTELSSTPAPPDDSLRSFSERADRVARRLHELERVPVSRAAASVR